ncbi:MAG: glutathione S-transferase family protein [Haliea sp.]|uniref:glutathione S-transferase family protein n=1 Tax=Haliea sp. TaxID=1932666 RepID=UPI0032EB1B62
MLTLHGFAASNYYNIVKHCLLHKGVPFTENLVYPGSPELLAVSPAGKVPALTTAAGTHLSESSVLVEYIEDVYPEKPLLPADPEQRARVRQVMKVAELYLELPARRLLPAVLGNLTVHDSVKKEVQATLDKGTASLAQLVKFEPWVCGAELTLADIYLRYVLAIPKLVGPSQLGWEVLPTVPGLAEWDARMAEDAVSGKVDADQQANMKEFRAYVSKLMSGARE